MTIDELKAENKSLQEKLDIAVKALKKIELLKNIKLSDKAKIDLSFKLSREALAKIKEIK